MTVEMARPDLATSFQWQKRTRAQIKTPAISEILTFHQFNASLVNKSIYFFTNFKREMHNSVHNNIVLFSTLIIIRNASYHYDFWTCDSEDDAENTDLITEMNFSLTDIPIENSSFELQ